LFVSFILRDDCRQAPLILGAIEELGQATRVFSATWYVRSSLAAAEAARRVWDVMDHADSLIVVDASSDEVAMFNVDDHCVRFMSRCWHLPVLEARMMHEIGPLPAGAPHASEIRSAAS
jgi:hypothetical protein